MFKVAFKNVWARKFRLVTTGFAIILGVAFMSGGLVLTDTMGRAFDTLFTDLGVGTDALVRSSEKIEAAGGFGGGFTARPRIDATAVSTVEKVSGVAHVNGEVNGFAKIIGPDGQLVGPQGGPPNLGINWSDDPGVQSKFDIVEGRAPAAADEAVIDRASAKEGHFVLGSPFRALTKNGPAQFKVVGITAYGTQDSALGASLVALTDESAQRWFGEPGKFDDIRVRADKGVSQTELRDRIDAALPASFEVITGADQVAENKSDISGLVNVFRTVLTVFALITLFVGSFIIYNTFSILAAQRTREMALLRAVGASRRQLLGSMLVEAIAVGVVAALVGFVAGVGVAGALKALFHAIGFELPALGLVVRGRTAMVAIILGSVVTVVAAIAPARRAARVPPVAAMRDVALASVDNSKARIVLGGLVTAFGALSVLGGLFGGTLVQVAFGAVLTFLGAAALGPLLARPMMKALGRPVAASRGITGRLARDNAMRNPKRTSRTAAALLIGVALVGFITIVAASVKASFRDVFDKQFHGDFVVQQSGAGFDGNGLSPALARSMKSDPALGTVAALRSAPAVFNGKSEFMTAFDGDGLGNMFDFKVTDGDPADLGPDGLAISRDKADREGWGIGTKVPVRFLGGGEIPLTVKLIYEDDTIAGSHFVGIPVFDAHVQDNTDGQIYIDAAPGVSDTQARSAIQNDMRAYPTAKVQGRNEWITERSGMIDFVLNLVYVFLALSVLIAMFGIANTLALSVVERTRELGLLRAVGMTRSQLRSTIRWEAVLIAVFGTIGGLLIGAFFGWAAMQALKDSGFELFRIPVTRMVVIAAIAAGFAVVAAWFPARRAGKLDVLRAIATD